MRMLYIVVIGFSFGNYYYYYGTTTAAAATITTTVSIVLVSEKVATRFSSTVLIADVVSAGRQTEKHTDTKTQRHTVGTII